MPKKQVLNGEKRLEKRFESLKRGLKPPLLFWDMNSNPFYVGAHFEPRGSRGVIKPVLS
jgi:hypothetical protein